MASATITSKGQITLPKVVRERLGVKPGDRVAFREQEDGTIVVQPETVDLMSLRGMLKPRRKGVTIEQMKADVKRAATRR